MKGRIAINGHDEAPVDESVPLIDGHSIGDGGLM